MHNHLQEIHQLHVPQRVAYKAMPSEEGTGVAKAGRFTTPIELWTQLNRCAHSSASCVNTSSSIGRNPVSLSRHLGQGERGNHVSALTRDRLLRASPSRRGAYCSGPRQGAGRKPRRKRAPGWLHTELPRTFECGLIRPKFTTQVTGFGTARSDAKRQKL